MKIRRADRLWAVLAAVSLTLAGCSSDSDSPQASPEADDSNAISVVDLAEQEITLDKPIDKAVIFWSGSGGPFLTMSALFGEEVPEHIAGWGGNLKDFRKDMYDAFVADVPALEDIPVVGTPGEEDFNVEKVLELNPDAVVAPIGLREALEEGPGETLKQAHIPVIFTDYHTEDVEVHEKTTALLGEIFGRTEEAQKIIDFRDEGEEILAEGLAKVADEEKPRAYVEVGYQGPGVFNSTYGSGFMWGGLLEQAGGENIAASSIAASDSMAPEAIIAADPEVIILTGSYWPSEPDSLRMGYDADEDEAKAKITEFTERPGWSELDAVKNERVYAINHGIAREPFDIVSTLFIAKALYPDAFADVDPQEMLGEYFRDIMPYHLDGVWMLKWR
ncbi:MAG: ABC transporter substrate-binding protein [Flaviflexus sp.]|nr:ABC transporter substrate-binding protein [Flaviflexus sp.]